MFTIRWMFEGVVHEAFTGTLVAAMTIKNGLRHIEAGGGFKLAPEIWKGDKLISAGMVK